MMKLSNLNKFNKSFVRLGRNYVSKSTSFTHDPYKVSFDKHHIPINNFQRVLLSIGSAAVAVMNPYRADMVACLGETTGGYALEYITSQMEKSEEGSQILEEKPRINSRTLDLDRLRKMPDDTLGKTYINFLDDNKVTPDSRDPVRFVEDIQLAYVMQRYREIHDFAHAILGMNISILGEITIKWFEAVQNKLPMCYAGGIFGPLQMNQKERKDFLKYNLPWALETGRNGGFLMNVYFEKRWEQPIHDLRKELNIKPLVIK
ncbi:hypothetical protein HHI36_018428 [Cryptolaemus montrouzieri]|uniref:Ubiquinone biosynthesis protein COQ4 homolog, mitochondrial n=1 Tax=Cryptolaemus montrouzieri TaxID=559131 RepID=A0ABD2NZY1_9CUCU